MQIGYRHIVCTLTILAPFITAAADVEQTTSDQTHTRIEATQLSEADRRRATVWNLNEEEWRRYDTLLKGIRGSVSPASLSPIEVLGIHARDAAERRRYAERWARAMREDAERILAFQRAYNVAAQRLFGDQDLIDITRLAGRTTPTPDLQSDDRLMFFATADCPACDAVFAKVLSHIEAIDGADVYFVDVTANKQGDIRNWAKRLKVDAAWVRSRRITLNVDDGVLHSIDPSAGEPPLLFVKRDGAIRPLAYAEL